MRIRRNLAIPLLAVCATACGAREVEIGAEQYTGAMQPDAGLFDAGTLDTCRDASAADCSGGGPVFAGIQVGIQEDPFALTLTYKSAPVTSFSAGTLSAFYLTDLKMTRRTTALKGPVTQTVADGASITDRRP